MLKAIPHNSDCANTLSKLCGIALISKCRNLKVFITPDSFFTFQQFAWLKSKMPNVQEGLDCVCEYGEKLYAIIGRRTPKMLDNIAKVQKYQKRYELLIEKYKNRENPPNDQEKD